jgi:hypothetical protein
MATPHDIAFAGAAVKEEVLTSDQVNLGVKVQKILGELGVIKPLADVVVEAGWVEPDRAARIVAGMRKLGVVHPELKPRAASTEDVGALEHVNEEARRRLETASRTLASLFYARSAGSLAVDQGVAAGPPTRSGRRLVDPTPTPSPARRVKVIRVPVEGEVAAPPRRLHPAIGASLALVGAIIAITAFVLTRKNAPSEVPTPRHVASKPEPPPYIPQGKPPAAPPPSPPPEAPTEAGPAEPESDAEVEARRRRYLEEQEREAKKMYEEARQLIAEGRPVSARGKLKRLAENYGWTEFVKLRKDEIARLIKDSDTDVGSSEGPSGDSEPMPEGPALPAMAAALKRLEDGAAADAKRFATGKTRLSGARADLALRGGKIIKGAEIVDISREDFRVRGEIDGAKADLLLSWAALDAAAFLSLQRQIAKGQGAAGQFELGRMTLVRRLWKDAKTAFDDCVRAEGAWKTRVPDVAAALATPTVLRGAARRLGDGRLLVEYSFSDPEQAGDFTPQAGTSGAREAATGTLKMTSKDAAVWSLKDLAFDRDFDAVFEVEGEAAIGAISGDGKGVLLFMGPSGTKLVRWNPGPGETIAESSERPAAMVPVRVEFRDPIVRVVQGERELLCAVCEPGSGLRRVVLGSRGESTWRNLWIAGRVGTEELARRLGPLDRLEGGAHAGDFRLEPAAADAEAASRAVKAEAALVAGDLEEAGSLAEEAVARAPTSALGVAVRGLVRLAQGETRLAVTDADLALALDPCNGGTRSRALRILASIRGPAAYGAHRRKDAAPWEVRTDGSEERLAVFAATLEEATRRFADALKEAGAPPNRPIRATVFSSRETYLAYLEVADSREVVALDGPGMTACLLRGAARAYLRAAVPAPPGWLEEGMTSLLAGEARTVEMKKLLPRAAPLEELLKKPAEQFTEADRIQAASVVRFFLGSQNRTIISDLLQKLRHGVPAIEAFSGRSFPKLEAEWKAWAATDGGK